jgi:hypothetical protein
MYTRTQSHENTSIMKVLLYVEYVIVGDHLDLITLGFYLLLLLFFFICLFVCFLYCLSCMVGGFTTTCAISPYQH